MDNSLHFRHTKATQNKCETCHHAYDDKAKKLFYAKGQEGTCRYCHQMKTVENRISMPLASHMSCVECHRLGKEKKLEAGPVTCGGCHDSKAQMKIKKVEPLPRMERHQPDTVFVKTLGKDEKADIPRMNPVPFDHKSHEGYNDTCRVCHHASLTACNACHALGETPRKEAITCSWNGPCTSGIPRRAARVPRTTQTASQRVRRVPRSSCPRAGDEQNDSCLKCHMKPLTGLGDCSLDRGG